MSCAPNHLSGNGGVEEWLELESDPGVFSLLVEDYGVRGVKVEEIYDLSQKFDSQVLGFVFLFRYELTDRRARKKARDLSDIASYVVDDNIVNDMFYAHQIITNSCATHALLSVLLNCRDLNIGPNLTRLKEFTKGLDPESKGFAIANMMELAHIHNKHARPPRTMVPPVGGRKSSIVSSAYALLPDTYHYVSFVPINGRLFELDGLKEFPIDHGPWGELEKWTDLFQRTLTQRLVESQDCLFNLLALVPDPVPQISEHLKRLHNEQTELLKNAVELAREVISERGEKVPVEEKPLLCENDLKQEIPSMSADISNTTDEERSRTVIKQEADDDNGIADVKKEDSPNTTPEKLSSDNTPKNDDANSDQDTKSETIMNTHEEPMMDCTEPSQSSQVAALLGDVSKDLPADASELDAVANTPLDCDGLPLNERLHIAVAKVVMNYKEAEGYKMKLKDEIETKQRFRVEHSRRIHDYDAFVFDFVKCMAQNKQLPERLLRRPIIAPPPKGNVGGRRKRKRGAGRPRTTLLLNGDEVS